MSLLACVLSKKFEREMIWICSVKPGIYTVLMSEQLNLAFWNLAWESDQRNHACSASHEMYCTCCTTRSLAIEPKSNADAFIIREYRAWEFWRVQPKVHMSHVD